MSGVYNGHKFTILSVQSPLKPLHSRQNEVTSNLKSRILSAVNNDPTIQTVTEWSQCISSIILTEKREAQISIIIREWCLQWPQV